MAPVTWKSVEKWSACVQFTQTTWCVILLMEEILEHQLICRVPFEAGFHTFSVGDALFLPLRLLVY